MNKKVKKELFNGLADWIIDKEPNYPSFGECKLWIKKQNSQYVISKNDEKEILMFLTYLPMSQKMNSFLIDVMLICVGFWLQVGGSRGSNEPAFR